VRLTAVDIHSKDFGKGAWGYNPKEVDDFRQEIADNFEEMQLELAAVREELERANKELEHYRSLEKSMNESLIFAQRSADEVRANSHKEAELILRNAENEAREVVARARSERAAIERQIGELEAARDRFAEEFSSMIAALADRLESFQGRAASRQAAPYTTDEPDEPQAAEPPSSDQPRATIPDWLGRSPQGTGNGNGNGS
jgi:cell division initiation protein